MIHKTTRSILSVLLAALLLVTSTPLTPAFAGEGGTVSPQSESGEGPFAGGTGTADDPYQIATAEELWDFAELVNGTDGNSADPGAHAKLMNDINLSEICGENVDGQSVSWTPIGNEAHRYTGTFDGDGHTISGLYIDSSDNDYKGLFGYLSTDGNNTGTVKDLSVSGSVKGDWYVGGVVGRNGGNVINCTFSGSVSGNIYVGGVVGQNGGTVENCYNTGSVSGNSVGGVVGYNSSTVENCYNTGTVNVSGNGYVGGVVGLNDGSSSTVENCYNTGTVTGTDDYVGGVVGLNFGGTVKNCYNTGTVTGTDDYVGGVVGDNGGNGNVTDCYFLQTDGVNENLPGIGGGSAEGAKSLTADQFKNQTSFTDWDFDSTWKIESIFGRPTLQANAEIGGTANNPYKIFTATQLAAFRDIVNDENGQVKDSDAHAKLMNNIDLNPGITFNANGTYSSPAGVAPQEWTPIGTSSSNSYRGTFDGNGHKIENLYINTTDSGAENQGLFGLVGTGGTVQNLTVSGSVKGHSYVGGVVGYNNGGTVTGCIFSGSGSVSGSYSVGGVVGRNFGGTVENCYNTGSVNGSADSRAVGGVVGRNNSNGTVTNCTNTGSVSGPGNRVGGVVGYNRGSSTVTGCYFLQTETVNTKLQGIGENDGSGVATATATAKDNTAFHSGEVTYLLGEAWGQNLMNEPKDNYPQLRAFDADTPQVYKVAFMNDSEEHDAKYANNGMTVGSPTTNPTKEGYTFAGWKDENDSVPSFPITVSGNLTYYAQWTAVEEPEPEPEEPPYTGKYSYELSTSVGDHGSLTVDRYATEGDKVTITVTPDEAYKLDDLSVTAKGKDVELTANGDGTYTFTMPSADVRISATFAEDPDWTEPEEPATDVSDIFLDVTPNAWYKDAVQYAYDNGLMTGVSDTEFAPEATTTRAMIVSILARLEGVTTAEAAGFADVDDNDWYATAVNWAANVGVVNGYEDNTFKPNTAITREQLAAILMNYAAYKGEDVSNRADLTSYTDQPSTWAQEAMQWAVAEGLITGVTNDELQPQGNATRAQVAAILQRFLDK